MKNYKNYPHIHQKKQFHLEFLQYVCEYAFAFTNLRMFISSYFPCHLSVYSELCWFLRILHVEFFFSFFFRQMHGVIEHGNMRYVSGWYFFIAFRTFTLCSAIEFSWIQLCRAHDLVCECAMLMFKANANYSTTDPKASPHTQSYITCER